MALAREKSTSTPTSSVPLMFHEGEAEESKQEPELGGVLGLKLTKTQSLVDVCHMVPQEKHGPCDETSHNKASNKTKASKIPFMSLRIGNWTWDSMNEGDLIAKLYFARKRVVWEVLAGQLKCKFEIPWDDITAISFTTISQDGIPRDILQVQLGKRPWFFKEITPLPKKHTNWESHPDFTGGEATNCRVHSVIFNVGHFTNHYKMLLESDKKIFELSQKPFPSHESPYFPDFVPIPQLPPSLPTPFEDPYPFPAFNPTNNPTPTFTANGINNQFVMDHRQPCYNRPMITDNTSNPLGYNMTNTLERMTMMPSPSTSRASTLDYSNGSDDNGPKSSSTSRAITLGYSNDFDNGPNQFVGMEIGPFQHEEHYQRSDTMMKSSQSDHVELPPYPESNINLDGFQTQPMNLANFSETNGVMEIDLELDSFIHNPYVVGYTNNPQQYQNLPHGQTRF